MCCKVDRYYAWVLFEGSHGFVVQEEGLDTVDANRALGLPDDCREYSSVRNILQNLGIRSIRLMVSALRTTPFQFPFYLSVKSAPAMGASCVVLVFSVREAG